MWLKAILVVVFSVAFAKGSEDKAEFKQDNGVYVLTDDDFDAFLEKHKTCLIEFYAPWCGHCKQLAPEYEIAAKKLAQKSPFVPLAKVDSTVEKKISEKYGVNGYPTLKFWKDGEVSDYEGPREADGIVEWIGEKTDPNYKPPPSDVIVLTKDNFAEEAETAELILIEFYAPWCGHCKKLAPEYEKAARKLKSHKVKLAKVDATVEPDLAKQFGVSGYPTLKILRKGKRFDYNGPREADGIIEYMKQQVFPAARELKTLRDVQKFFSHDDVTILGFFDPDTDYVLMDNFKEAAEATREEFKAVGYTTDKEAIAHYKMDTNTVAVFHPERFRSKFEPKFKSMEKSGATKEDLLAFWRESAVPLVGQRTQANQALRYSKKPLIVVYYGIDFGHEHYKDTQFWRQKVLNVAKDFSSTFTFAISDEEEFKKELEEVGLGESGAEVNSACFGKDGRRYPWVQEDDEFTEEGFRDFIKKLNTGRVKAHIKSQPIPKDDKGPVKTVVAANFDKVVKDASKDVLIEFYAPWCGHCKQLEPIYKDLAKKLKSETNLVIAKMDATTNDTPDEFKVEGFPTIYFVPAGKKDEPILFKGGRDLESMEKFIKENAAASFKGKKSEL